VDELDLESWEGDVVWIGVKLHNPAKAQPPLAAVAPGRAAAADLVSRAV